MEIRKATVADAACISSIFWESWQTGYRGLIDQAYLDGLRPDHWQAFFASQLRPGSLEAQVAMLGPEAAGAVAYGAFIPPTGSQVPARGDGYVQALYVRPAFIMRQGVGSGLLQAAEEGLRAMGYGTAFLYVLDTNEKARRFYEKQGYRWNGERLGCRAGEQELTDLCYETGCRKSGLRHFFEVFIAPLRLRRGQGAMQGNPCYARLFADLPYMPPNPIKA